MSIRIVLILSVTLFSVAAHAQGQYCGGADLNGDGVIGVPDFALFTECFGNPLSNPPAEGILGVSEDTVIPEGAGWMGMNGACVATFGAGAHMCLTTDTAKATPPVAMAVGDSVWVRPDSDGATEGFTGLANASTFNCNRWTGGGQHMVIERTADGVRMEFRNCAVANPVLCCR
jgi:hypothetical protein